jgi:hypothetical protein
MIGWCLPDEERWWLEDYFRHGKMHTQQNIKTNHSKVGLCGIHGQCPPPEAMPKFPAEAKDIADVHELRAAVATAETN